MQKKKERKKREKRKVVIFKVTVTVMAYIIKM